MNYQKIYDRLMSKALCREVIPEVIEIHHIVPRCIEGPDIESNLVRLTPEEHYVAHQLLVKLHPKNGKLIFAALSMTGTGNGQGNGRKGNKLYGWLKRRFIANQTGSKHSEETKRKIGTSSKTRNRGVNHPMWGRKHSEETKLKWSTARKGKPSSRVGKKWSEESKQILSDLKKDHFKNGGKTTKGYKHTEETKAKMRDHWANRLN